MSPRSIVVEFIRLEISYDFITNSFQLFQTLIIDLSPNISLLIKSNGLWNEIDESRNRFRSLTFPAFKFQTNVKLNGDN
jgi:hypothetical protein